MHALHALEGAETAESELSRKKIPMINGNGMKVQRFGSVLLKGKGSPRAL